jgi:endothelin-converting enzyme/putative endopeptidase
MKQYQNDSGINYAYVDDSVRPQDDLFRYVNGQWLKTYTLPDDKSAFGSFEELHEKSQEDVKELIKSASEQDSFAAKTVSAMYESYMDEKKLKNVGLDPLQKDLQAIADIQNLKDLSGYLGRAQVISTAPFSLYVAADSKKPDTYITYMGQSGLGLPNRDYYFHDDPESQNILKAYKAYMTSMLTQAGVKDAAEASERVFSFEKALAQHHWEKEKLRDPLARYNKKTVEEVQALLSNLYWQPWKEAVVLPDVDNIVVGQPGYLQEVNDLLKTASLETWKNYFTWHLINSKAFYLTPALAKEKFDFYRGVLSGVKEQEPRWKRAVNHVNGSLGELVGKMYVDQHFSTQAKTQMLALVENLRKAYAQAISELDWMSEKTKKQALVKLAAFTPKIGYPDRWKDYSSLSLSEDDLYGNVAQVIEWELQDNRSKLGKPVDKTEWFMNPQTVNAYYHPVMNEIVFPAAILQPPFFNPNADSAVNYGGIGAVIGHEMGHGFDDKGSLYNEKGELKNWWTEEDKKAFDARTQKLVDQFNQFTVLDGKIHVNGEFTQGENIGDLSGLSIAYRAYQISLDGKPAPVIDGYTGDQRFFMGWAQVWRRKFTDQEMRKRIETDPHSPSEFRTNGTVMNMPEFIQAFEVQPSDQLYRSPEQRVKIW